MDTMLAALALCRHLRRLQCLLLRRRCLRLDEDELLEEDVYEDVNEDDRELSLF